MSKQRVHQDHPGQKIKSLIGQEDGMYHRMGKGLQQRLGTRTQHTTTTSLIANNLSITWIIIVVGELPMKARQQERHRQVGPEQSKHQWG
jgi:hypothetical protein